MEEKYGKLNETFRERIKHLIPHNHGEKKNRIECSSQILKEQKKYYKNLLKTRQSDTTEETQIQCKVEEKFQQVTNRQGDKK